MHSVQGEGCVDQRLALFDRACLHRHVHHIRAKAFARDLEAGLGAGRILEEHIDLGQALEGIGVLAGGPVLINILIRQIQYFCDLGLGQALDAEEMAVA